jgi:pimeloyl-ACP methyl ester carboxylesterase
MNTIDVDGIRIAYRRAGEGPPLVPLHGGPTDSHEWSRQLDDLSDQFHRRRLGHARMRCILGAKATSYGDW